MTKAAYALLATICLAQDPDPLLKTASKLPLSRTEFGVPATLEMVSSVAVDPRGSIYLLQRGDKADPVIVADSKGRIIHSWGKGLYKIPHSIRVDPQGNVWTTDAGSSLVIEYSPLGKKLLEIKVELPANPRSAFCGTTDIAFAPNGHLFIADGYGNARILEYTREGKRVRNWGSPGTGPGQFNLPHGIAIDENGVIYVADRENGRIQKFDLNGKFLGEWVGFGKTFSLDLRGSAIWIGTQRRKEPNGSPGWLMKLDRQTGKLLGYVESTGHHSIAVTRDEELWTGTRPDKVLWFRKP